MDKFFCIHHQNIQRLLIEIYKDLHDISWNSLKELLVKRESTISLWYKSGLVIPSVNSILKGKNSIRSFDSVIWNSLPLPCVAHVLRYFPNPLKHKEGGLSRTVLLPHCSSWFWVVLVRSDFFQLVAGRYFFYKRQWTSPSLMILRNCGFCNIS